MLSAFFVDRLIKPCYNIRRGSDNVHMFFLLGKINTHLLEQEFGKFETDEVIVTDERMEHIKDNHPQDVELFEPYAGEATLNPDLIIKDLNHPNTVFMIKRLKNTNLNVIVKLAIKGAEANIKNSVISFYRIRNKNLKKLEKNNKVLYKCE